MQADRGGRSGFRATRRRRRFEHPHAGEGPGEQLAALVDVVAQQQAEREFAFEIALQDRRGAAPGGAEVTDCLPQYLVDCSGVGNACGSATGASGECQRARSLDQRQIVMERQLAGGLQSGCGLVEPFATQQRPTEPDQGVSAGGRCLCCVDGELVQV